MKLTERNEIAKKTFSNGSYLWARPENLNAENERERERKIHTERARECERERAREWERENIKQFLYSFNYR
jgi:hypothetical protein